MVGLFLLAILIFLGVCLLGGVVGVLCFERRHPLLLPPITAAAIVFIALNGTEGRREFFSLLAAYFVIEVWICYFIARVHDIPGQRERLRKMYPPG